MKGGRDGENSANKKGLTFSLSCCIRSGPLSTLRRQNTTRFLSSDEQQASRQGETKGRGKGRRGANPGEADNGKCGQDFEQSQSNHGWPRVAVVHGLGTRCGSLVRSNIRSKSGPSSLNFLDTTTRITFRPASRLLPISHRLSVPRGPIARPDADGSAHHPHSLYLVLLVLLTVPCPLLFIACT